MYLRKYLTSANKKFYITAISTLLVLVYLPELITWLTQPEGYVFNGGFLNITDFNVYLSAIRQGAEGKWLFEPQFTPESFPPYFAFAPYILTGKIMSLTGGSVLLWYHLLKFFSLIWALDSLLALIDTSFPGQERLQKTTFFMLLFSSGLGWLLLPAIGNFTLFTPDLFVPEWNLINGAFASPHFLLGIACQTAFFRRLLIFFSKQNRRNALLVAVAGIGLSLAYPYLIIVDGLVLAAYLIFQVVQTRKIPWQQILVLGTACIPMISALLYYGLLLPRDPLYQMLIVANNEIHPPPLLGLMIGLGLLLPLAIAGIRPWWQNQRTMIIPFWLGINLLAIYLPFSFSGRFISGLIIPLIILAAYGFESTWLPWITSLSDKKPSFLANLTYILTIPSTALFVVYFTMVLNTYNIFPYYFQQTEHEAAVWLAEAITDEDLLLAEFPMCNLLPRYGNGRVFSGHFDLTVDMEGKAKLMETFWQKETSDQWRQEFIDQWGFTYIYQGRFENAHVDGEPMMLPYEIIYQTKDDLIYRIP